MANNEDLVNAILRNLQNQGASAGEGSGQATQKGGKVDESNVDWETTLLSPYKAADILTKSKGRGTVIPQTLYHGVRSGGIASVDGKVTINACIAWLDRKKVDAGSVQTQIAQNQNKTIATLLKDLKSQVQLSDMPLPDRFFGVEVEFDPGTVLRKEVVETLEDEGIAARIAKYSDTNYDKWLVKNDTSCGMEAVSPKIKGKEGLAMLIRVLKLLQQLKVEVNRKCAFQVHWDATDMSLDQMKRLVIAYTTWEPLIDRMVSPSRRGDNNEYAKSLRGIDRQGMIAATTIEELIGSFEIKTGDSFYNYRKWKVSLFKANRTGSIEFRQHQGTLDPEKAIRWIAFTAAIVEFAKGGSSIAPAKSITQLCKVLGLSDQDIEYWKARIEELEA